MECAFPHKSCVWTSPHPRGFVAGMNDDIDYDDITQRLFALITANAEDLATLAIEGQAAGLGSERRAQLTNQVASISTSITTLADAVSAINLDQG